jgi:Ca-activated chloride channel family protein
MKQITFLLFACFLVACTIKTYKTETTSSASITTTKSADATLCFITGKVIDANTQEELIGASVKLKKNNNLVKGTITDISGDFRIQVDPGTYDIECSYTGFATFVQQGVQVKLGEISNVIIQMKDQTALQSVDLVAYKVPLIKQDQTMGGQTLSFDQINKLPSKSVIESKKAKTPSDDSEVKIKGARANGNNYYIDGVRVFGSNAIPVQDIEKLQVIQGNLDMGEIQNAGEIQIISQKQQDIDEKEALLEKIPGVKIDSIIPEASTEQYNKIVENPFIVTKASAFSTFSIDVDAASYANVRRFLNDKQTVPPDAVRIEEMINYFNYNYPQPDGNDPIKIVTELGKCPWNPDHHLLMVGLQARNIAKERVPEGNFVFLVDVSGSMNSDNKLPLVKKSLFMLLDELRPTDRVALVTYAGATAVILESTPASEKEKIKTAIGNLGAGGGTAGASGIQLAYQTARANFKQQGNNRVILCTDGDFNLGQSSESELVKLIEKERESGVYLTVLGYGTGNYQDGKMQELANRGNGNHAYIDQIGEAKKVLVEEFTGTMFTIAKDVKLQLVFNPEQVQEYRLIGYENRMLAREDFDNDAKDAGELGAGHTVTALYEIIPNAEGKGGDLMQLKFRYKAPTGDQGSRLVAANVPAVCAAQVSDNFNFAAAVAESGLLLRNSSFKGSAAWESVLAHAKLGLTNDKEGYRKEFVELMKKAK